MKLNSSIFDSIRVKPSKDRRRKADQPRCEKPGCENAATSRAPKNLGKENDYWNFCVEHAREFNHSYNFFKDMSVDEVAKYQKDAQTGHRPTWKLGERGAGTRKPGTGRVRGRFKLEDAADDFGVLGGGFADATARAAEQRTRTVHNAARKAFSDMGLDIDADKTQIKAKFKELVKRHHPDANGGDRAFEDRLREIIVAYNYLKSAGYC
jgi:hypothetical protein